MKVKRTINIINARVAESAGEKNLEFLSEGNRQKETDKKLTSKTENLTKGIPL